MNQKLIINSKIIGEEIYVSIEGIIDEDADFEKIKSLHMKKFIFDFNKLTMINSCGIREWIKYIREVEGSDVYYINCPQIVIEQVNMVHGFIRKGIIVESFYAPYYCVSCDVAKKILLKSSEVTNLKSPVEHCDTCKNILEFDAIEKQYFSFLNQGK